jgi:quercetin dioxygenase-like cupin family protein
VKAPSRVLPFPERPRPAPVVTLWARRDRPGAATLRAQLTSEGYQVVAWSSGPAEGFPPHAHIYPELLLVVEGELTVLLPAENRMLDLGPGDRVELPAGMVHGTMAGADGATYLLATR